MINLKTLEGETVRLASISGKVYTGKITDYIWPEDNDPEVESIIMEYPTRDDGFKCAKSMEFTAPEILAVEIV